MGLVVTAELRREFIAHLVQCAQGLPPYLLLKAWNRCLNFAGLILRIGASPVLVEEPLDFKCA